MNSKYKFEDNQLQIEGKDVNLPSKYSLVSIAGSGANGVVIKARDNELERVVAIKIWMPRNGVEYPDTTRFYYEARKIARLSNEKIAIIHTCDSLNNDYFYAVFEYIPGETLRDWLSSEKKLAERFSILNQICDAMQYAHNQDVYHGDLHTNNIMITLNDQVKILDFGTSFFCKELEGDPTIRERELILETGLKLLKKESAGDFLDHNFIKNLPPKCIPFGLKSLNSFIWGINNLPEYTDEIGKANFVYSIALEILLNPIYDLTAILGFVESIGYEETYLSSLLGSLSFGFKCNLFEDNCEKFNHNSVRYTLDNIENMKLLYLQYQSKYKKQYS